jgi:hypothetical protein
MSRRNDVRIEVEGLKEFQKELRAAKDKDTPKAIKAANKQSAEIVAKEAKTLVPKLSGKLGRSIRSTASARKGEVAAGRSNLPYAGPIHFGWAAHNIKPQPFIYDAADRRRDEVFATYEKQISQIVEGFRSGR